MLTEDVDHAFDFTGQIWVVPRIVGDLRERRPGLAGQAGARWRVRTGDPVEMARGITAALSPTTVRIDLGRKRRRQLLQAFLLSIDANAHLDKSRRDHQARADQIPDGGVNRPFGCYQA
jgi:hypothetical protein